MRNRSCPLASCSVNRSRELLHLPQCDNATLGLEHGYQLLLMIIDVLAETRAARHYHWDVAHRYCVVNGATSTVANDRIRLA